MFWNRQINLCDSIKNNFLFDVRIPYLLLCYFKLWMLQMFSVEVIYEGRRLLNHIKHICLKNNVFILTDLMVKYPIYFD